MAIFSFMKLWIAPLSISTSTSWKLILASTLITLWADQPDSVCKETLSDNSKALITLWADQPNSACKETLGDSSKALPSVSLLSCSKWLCNTSNYGVL